MDTLDFQHVAAPLKYRLHTKSSQLDHAITNSRDRRQLTALFAAGSGEDEMFTQGARIRSRLFYKAKVKSLRMTALIVLAFIICWTPYQVSFFNRTSELLGAKLARPQSEIFGTWCVLWCLTSLNIAQIHNSS